MSIEEIARKIPSSLWNEASEKMNNRLYDSVILCSISMVWSNLLQHKQSTGKSSSELSEL